MKSYNISRLKKPIINLLNNKRKKEIRALPATKDNLNVKKKHKRGGDLVKVLKGSRRGPRGSTLFVPFSFRLLITRTEHTNTHVCAHTHTAAPPALCPALSHIPELTLLFMAL